MPWSKYGEVFGSLSVPKKNISHNRLNAKKISNYANNLLLFIDQYIVAIREKLLIIEKNEELASN